MEANNFVLWTNANCDNSRNVRSNSICEKTLNFSTATTTSEEDEYGSFHDRRKMSRDPMSHRIIEKRRRDRMNNCLADLSRLIPADYLKKGRGRIEKTEIIEMAIKHMKHLHTVVCSPRANVCPTPELPLDNNNPLGHTIENFEPEKSRVKEEDLSNKTVESLSDRENGTKADSDSTPPPINLEHFKLGYQECLSESMHYLVEVKGYYPGSSLCMQLICHLQKHCDKILKGDRLNKPRTEDSTSTSSPGSNRPHGSGSGSSSSDSCERLPKQEPMDTMFDPSSHLSAHSSSKDLTVNRDTSFDHHRPSQGHQRLQFESSPSAHPSSYGMMEAATAPHRDGGEPNTAGMCPQTRDHLTTPNLSMFNFEQENQCFASNRASSLSRQLEYPTETSPCPSGVTDTQSLYKFKNNIKQRFTAEHSSIPPQNGSSSGYVSAPPTKKSRSSSDLTPTKYYDSPSNDSNCGDLRSSNEFSSELSHQRYHHNEHRSNRSVAIFVLHSDGTFYIPLTVDYSVLVPYLGNVNKYGQFPYRNSSLVLHPVTISVSFQQNSYNSNMFPQSSGSGNSASSDFSRNSHLKTQK